VPGTFDGDRLRETGLRALVAEQGLDLRGVLAGLSLGVAGSLMVIASAGTGYGDYQLHLVGAFLRLPAFCGLGANPRMDCRGDALEGVGGLGTILLRLCDALDVQSSGALDFVARGAPDYNAKGRQGVGVTPLALTLTVGLASFSWRYFDTAAHPARALLFLLGETAAADPQSFLLAADPKA
jgi:hypothetical protein